jgi:heat shock protein HslJ
MRTIPVLLVAALTVAGCAVQADLEPGAATATASSNADVPVFDEGVPAPVATPSQAGIRGLDGTRWRFVEVGGRPVPAPVTATMRLKDGRASGRAGCNAYGAKYHVDRDGEAGFTQSLSTRMACLKPAGAMQVERGVFDAFRQTAKVAIVNGDLLMLDAAGNLLARLAPIGSP